MLVSALRASAARQRTEPGLLNCNRSHRNVQDMPVTTRGKVDDGYAVVE